MKNGYEELLRKIMRMDKEEKLEKEIKRLEEEIKDEKDNDIYCCKLVELKLNYIKLKKLEIIDLTEEINCIL